MTFVQASFKPTMSGVAQARLAPKHVPLGTAAANGSSSQQWGANLPPMRIYPIMTRRRRGGSDGGAAVATTTAAAALLSSPQLAICTVFSGVELADPLAWP